MGKFYDAEKTNEYFEQIDTAIATYAEQANAVLSSFATFAGDDEQKGEQAEAVKELVGTGEKNLVDRMLDIQQQISEAGAHIREGFETGVDAAPDALIEEDTLLQIEDSFKGFYKTYDDLGTQIEDIATILQSKYGEYATFERPDFESGREAFKSFCGGAAAGGFLQECMEKLEDFDAAETSYLHGLNLDGLLSDFENTVNNTSAVFASLDMNDPSIAGETLESITLDANSNLYAVDESKKISMATRADPNRLEAKAAKREIDRLGRKIKGECDSEDVFDVNPNTINTTGAVAEVSIWDVDPSLFEPKERVKLDVSTDYYAQMSPEQQRMALKLYEDYVATEGKIEDEQSANHIAHLMERHFRVTGDSKREAEAIKLQTRTAGMATAAAVGAVDVLVKPLDTVYAAESALFGERDLDESGKSTSTVMERFANAWKSAQAQHDFSDIQAQHPVAYTSGKIAGNLLLYKGVTQSLGSISKVSEATTKAGNAIASKAGSVLSGNTGEIVSRSGEAIGRILQDTTVDVILDTIPTEIANASDGMSAGEVAWDTVKNVGGNVAYNVIGEAAPTVLKAIGGGDAAKNTVQSMPASMDPSEMIPKSGIGQDFYDDFCEKYGLESVDWLTKDRVYNTVTDNICLIPSQKNCTRLIPGVEGVVSGGDSTRLGKNMMEDMGLPRSTKWHGHNAQHIIPVEMSDHDVIKKIGMDMDDISNGMFLRIPGDDISTMSRHRGYHSTYNDYVRSQLDAMDITQSVDVLQKQVYDLQQGLRYLQQNGLPLYPSKKMGGATVELWERSMQRIKSR